MNTAASPKAEYPADATDFAPSWVVAPGSAAAEAWAGNGHDDDAMPLRRWRLLMAARLLLALALLALQWHAWRAGNGAGWLVAMCGALALLAAATLVFRPPRPTQTPSVRRPLSWPWVLTAWSDLAVIAVLHWAAPGGVSFVPLFVWPVLLAAVVGPRLLALGVAAAGTLVLLAPLWRQTPANWGSGDALQAAIAGTGLFATAWLAGQLTARLGSAQAAARRSRQLAELHSHVNRLIAAGLSEGVVVLDAQSHPWYANPAAQRILHGEPARSDPSEARPAASSAGAHATAGGVDAVGVATAAVAADQATRNDGAATPGLAGLPVRQTPAWPVLAHWVHDVLSAVPTAAAAPAPVLERTLDLPLGERRLRRIHARLHPIVTPAGDRLAVLLLEDTHAIEQRLRTERLATMGRVTAAVAHEIRNPLAAIAQASALLAEDDPSPAQRQLLAIIEQNVQRLERTVNDVLEAVRLPSAPQAAPVVALDATVNAAVHDWLHQHPQGERLHWLPGAREARIAFDPEHLRRVLVNLLDNADRHASAALDAIRVETRLLGGHALLTVWSEGPDIAPTVREHLFEPFASAHPRSSGLGLYLSRELCRRYHADLGYERSLRAQRAGNAFVVRMPLR